MLAPIGKNIILHLRSILHGVVISSVVFVSNYCRDLNAFPDCVLNPHSAV